MSKAKQTAEIPPDKSTLYASLTENADTAKFTVEKMDALLDDLKAENKDCIRFYMLLDYFDEIAETVKLIAEQAETLYKTEVNTNA